MTQPSASTAVGPRIGGRYVLVEEVGRGGMATVHRARDEVLDRWVAVKTLHPHLAGDPAFLERFRREARAAAALAHPNVVAVHDWGESDGSPYLVLQLVEGTTLRHVLRDRGRLSPRELAGILIPTSRGLGAAHAAGLVHRDVKPENVLLGRDGSVRITDFGLARAAASANATFGPDVLVGSPHYLSPEAVRGKPLDARADVYALGVMLYECLTGRPPHQGDSPYATAVAHTANRVPPPSWEVRDLDPALDEVVAWSTAIDRDQRYRDATDFGRALAIAIPGTSAGDGVDPALVRETAVLSRQAQRSTNATTFLDTDADDVETSLVAAPDAGPARPRSKPRSRLRERIEQDGADDVPRVHEDSRTDRTEPADADETDEAEPHAPRRRRRGLLVTLLIVGLLLGSAAGGYALWDRVLAPVTDVPDVRGRPAQEALDILGEAGFRPEIDPGTPAFDREVPDGHVLDQSTDGAVRQGSVVVLYLSAGPRQVEIVGARGDPAEDVTAQLDELGFEVIPEEQYDEDVDAGLVISITPEPGDQVDEGSEVTVVASRGPRPREVPNLHNLTIVQATAELEDLRLRINSDDSEYHDEIPMGQVIRQSPEAGDAIARGETVSVVMSEGPRPIEVPEVREMHIDEAKTTLEELGFVVHVEWRGGIGSYMWPGQVINQDPGPNARKFRGDTVTVWAYEEP